MMLVFLIGITFGMQPDEGDKYDPPLDRLGALHRVEIDGVSQVAESDLPIPIPLTGSMLNWKINIAAGEDAKVEIIHEGYFLAEKFHQWVPVRYTKNAKIYFEYSCSERGLPRALIEAAGLSKEFPIRLGERLLVAEVCDRQPSVEAFKFRLSLPK
ncbi:hypothetical protein [Azospirillum sp. sgz302134]